MTGSAWFTLSIGRKNRAEPRWVLPLICKAGGITRNDVGSIKIHDDHTRFEIAADKAEDFASRIAREGSGGKGVMISPAGTASHDGKAATRAAPEDYHKRSKPTAHGKTATEDGAPRKRSGKMNAPYRKKGKVPTKGKPGRAT